MRGALCSLRDEKGPYKALGLRGGRFLPPLAPLHPCLGIPPESQALLTHSPLISQARLLGEASRCLLNWKEQRNNDPGGRNRVWAQGRCPGW